MVREIKPIQLFWVFTLTLFLCVPLFYTLTRQELGIAAYLFSAFFLVFLAFFLNVSIDKNVFLFLIFYLSWLLLSLSASIFNNLSVKSGINQLSYYLKPVLFFLIGYWFLPQKRFDIFIRFVYFFTVIGSIFFFFKKDYFLTLAIERDSQGQGIAHFLGLNGQYIRNCSFYLSPLDTSFVSFFLAAYYFFKAEKTKSIVSAVVLIFTIARSSIIGLLVSLIFNWIFLVRSKYKSLWLGLFAITSTICVLLFFDKISYLFKDGSAQMHLENLTAVINDMISNPMGHGIGYSGWSRIGESDHLYSEGSFQTTLLENGILFVLIYLLLGYCIYRINNKMLLSIYFGYLAASLMIPIGFSTGFNLLFFGYLGVTVGDCRTK